VDPSIPGLIPQTLQPLLDKRVALKQRIASLPGWDPRKKLYQARAAAHKWLLVTCFGYLGYKNARFGRIEAHQAVTAYSRECLLRAKEAAEDLGYTVLHMYIDGLWVQPEAAPRFNECGAPASSLSIQAVQPLLDEIARRTGLPIALEGIYRWVAFLPSQADRRVPVANRYFGVFQDGSLKIRGLEARRGDTPPFIAAVQRGLLERLAAAVPPQAASPADPGTGEGLPSQALPEILGFLRRELRRLRQRRVPLEQLLVTQKLSRPLERYRSPSPAARAAAQLAAAGKPTRPGQAVRFLYLRGERNKGQDIHAWDCPPAPPPERLDVERYTTLFIRACAAVLQPFGLDEEALRLQLSQ
jgi:DNA polymerase-2